MHCFLNGILGGFHDYNNDLHNNIRFPRLCNIINISPTSSQQYSYFPARANPFAIPPPFNFAPQPRTNSFGSSVIHPRQSTPSIRANKFVYQSPTDSLIYHVSCEKISAEILNETINNKLRDTEYVFFYNQRCDNQIYKITCKLNNPGSLILNQKKDLEYNLVTYLDNYFIDNDALIRALLY